MENTYKDWKKLVIEARHRTERVLHPLELKLKAMEVEHARLEKRIKEVKSQVEELTILRNGLLQKEQQKCGGP